MEPDYAPAWAGLAHAYWMHAWFYLMPTQQAMPLLKEAALRTLELDDQLAQGHSSLGLFECGFEWNWPVGETRFRRAIDLQPGLAIIYPFYAVAALLPQLRFQEACSMVERGLSLDPFNPLFHAIAVFVYANAGRHDDALRQYALGLEANPLFPPTLGAGAIAYERAGRLDEAIPRFQKLCEVTQDRPLRCRFWATRWPFPVNAQRRSASCNDFCSFRRGPIWILPGYTSDCMMRKTPSATSKRRHCSGTSTC
ncbi:MAG TPA: tetratricopeptide repeat protein [Casimicrobiaceae bacterium]